MHATFWRTLITALCADEQADRALKVYNTLLGLGNTNLGAQADLCAVVLRALGSAKRADAMWSTYARYLSQHKAVPTMELFHAVLQGLPAGAVTDSSETQHRLNMVLDHMAAHEGETPDVNSYNMVINVLLALQPPAVQRAWGVIDSMRLSGVTASVDTYNTLAHALAAAGHVEEAHMAVSAAMGAGKAPDSTTLSILVDAAVKSGNLARALAIVEEFGRAGVRSDVVTLTALIPGWERVGQLDRAWEVFTDMVAHRKRAAAQARQASRSRRNGHATIT